MIDLAYNEHLQRESQVPDSREILLPGSAQERERVTELLQEYLMREASNPEVAKRFYKEQKGHDTCAIVAQEMIIHKRTGSDPGEEVLKKEAAERGWYHYGTPPEHVGKLLELYGIPVERQHGATIEELVEKLDQGKDVIVGVDAGIFWKDFRSRGSGHAVWVTGVERDNGRIVAVYVNDSGNKTIDGGGKIPIERFQRAWQVRGNYMIFTRD